MKRLVQWLHDFYTAVVYIQTTPLAMSFMSNFKKLLFVSVAVALSLSSLQIQPAGARGWGSYTPPKEYREPGVWYGDSYVAEDVKKATYSNYQGHYYAPATAPVANAQNYVNSGPYSTSQQFSGPDHIQPEQYHYFVQEYHWEKPRQ